MSKCKICQKLVDGFVLMQYFNRNKTHKWKWPKRGGKGESEIFLQGFMEIILRFQELGRILFEALWKSF